MINRTVNESFCLHDICVCSVYIYINTLIQYTVYFENIHMHFIEFIL